MSETSENPYLQSKALWNDLYGSVEDRLHKTYLILAIVVVALCLSVAGLILLAVQSRIQPYVAVVHGNELVTLTKFDKPGLETFKPKLATLLAKEFIEKARSLSLDESVNRTHFITALAMTSGAATPALKNFYPTLLANTLIEVHLTSLILESDRGIHARWQESKRDAKSGELLASESYSAELTFQFSTTSQNTQIAEHNPLGFYITSLAWSQDRVN